MVGAGVVGFEGLGLGVIGDTKGVLVEVIEGAKVGAEGGVSVGLSEDDVEGVVVGDEVEKE